MRPIPGLDPPSDELVARVAEVLRTHFPHASPNHTLLVAKSIAEAPSWGVAHHHQGKVDEKALNRLEAAFNRLNLALAQPSYWPQQSMTNFLKESYLRRALPRYELDGARPPLTIEEMKYAISVWKLAVDHAQAKLREGVPDNGKNWGAVNVVDEAVKCWDLFKAEDQLASPKRGLNPASPFANFLQDILDVLGIKATPVSAFRAWKREASSPDSHLGKPT